MRKIFLLLILNGIILLACSKTNQTCGVENPESDLPWLASLIENFSKDDLDQRITLYEYNEAEVYYIEDCLNCADALDIIRNCDGLNICEIGGIDGRNTCPDFSTNARQIAIIYTEI